jgi:hypothetical protein
MSLKQTEAETLELIIDSWHPEKPHASESGWQRIKIFRKWRDKISEKSISHLKQNRVIATDAERNRWKTDYHCGSS